MAGGTHVITFDWTFSIGNLIQLITLICALGAGYLGVNRKLDKLILQHDMIWRWFKREHGINGDEE